MARGCYGRGLASEARKRRGVERGVARVNWAASVIQTRRVSNAGYFSAGVERLGATAKLVLQLLTVTR